MIGAPFARAPAHPKKQLARTELVRSEDGEWRVTDDYKPNTVVSIGNLRESLVYFEPVFR